MKKYDEEIFEAVTEIVASTMEESEVELSAEGGKAVAEYFRAVYDGIAGCGPDARPGKFEVYRDASGEYRFRLKAANGEVIASSEGYKHKDSCLKCIDSIRKNAAYAEIAELED